jgi:hypothetical protein
MHPRWTVSVPDVLWIGGATASGKTTLARGLAARHGLRRYHIDDFWYAHDALLGGRELPPDEQWVSTSAASQVEAFYESSARRLRLVLDHLSALPEEPPVVVEGPQVLPDLLPSAAYALFLVPTSQFQKAILHQRPLPPTTDPQRALANRVEKDRLFGERIAGEAVRRGFEVIGVDGSRTPSDILGDAERRLATAPALRARRLDATDFRAVRRWENEARAANLRSWINSAHVVDGPLPLWPFACECGDARCADIVELTLDEFESRAQIRGHP